MYCTLQVGCQKEDDSLVDYTAHCAEMIVSAHWRAGSVSAERVGQVGAVHMAAARPGCKRTNSCPDCMSRVRKRFPHFLKGSFSALSGCLPTKSADYCMLVNEWAWLRSQVCLLGLKVHLGSFLESELRQK